MIKKELRKISLEYRTLSSQMLKIDSQEELNRIKIFFDFISNTPFIMEYISSCHTEEFDFKEQKEFIGTINEEVIRLNMLTTGNLRKQRA